MRAVKPQNTPNEKSKKINISYEEEAKQSFGELINDTTYRLYDIKASDIIDIFNEKLEFGKVDLEVRVL